MKKYFSINLVLVSALFLSACLPADGGMDFSVTKFQEVELGGENYFFRYPEDAQIFNKAKRYVLEFSNCKLDIGWGAQGDLRDSLSPMEKDEGDLKFTAWYQDEQVVLYDALVVDLDYYFSVGDGTADVSSCISFVDFVAESFTTELGYVNKKFGFALNLPADYEAEYFPDELGLALRKRMDVERTAEELEDGKESQYKVEILFMPFENTEKFPDISEFIAQKYQGYTIEFKDFGAYSGFFVGEGAGSYSIRHYFVMSDDRSVIFEAYLKVASEFYNEHQQEFDELMGELEFF